MSHLVEGQTIFVIDLEYTVPLSEVEPLLEGHMAYVAQGYDKGWFLSSGAKSPRTGGVILATAPTREELEKFVATDPFITAGVAKCTLTEFVARRSRLSID